MKRRKQKLRENPLEERGLLDTMHSALVDILIEKGLITEEGLWYLSVCSAFFIDFCFLSSVG